MKNKDIDFNAVVNWHEKLIDNKGQCAILKRCNTLAEIQLQAAYVELCQKLGRQGERIALIAGVLSHIKKDKYQPKIKFAHQMAVAKKGATDTPKITISRFKRLLNLKNKERLFRLLIRIIKQIDNFDMVNFSKDIFFWSDITKKRWAYDYYSSSFGVNKNPAMSTTGEAA